jgi:diacylglycerol kinase family enzyme
VRVLLVVNPRATGVSTGTVASVQRALDVAARRDPHPWQVETVVTTRAGHAADLAAQLALRRPDDLRAVLVLGGDGTVAEVAGGLLGDAHSPAPGRYPDVPPLGVLPGGATNVLARTLGLHRHPARAADQLAQALLRGSTRAISVGHLAVLDGDALDEDAQDGDAQDGDAQDGDAQDGDAQDGDAQDGDGVERSRLEAGRLDRAGRADRWFLLNAGFGLDAAAIARVEALRRQGRRSTWPRYAWATWRAWLERDVDAGLVLRSADGREREVGSVIVANTDPWSYLGERRLRATPQASFDRGLDVAAQHGSGLVPTLGALAAMAAHLPPSRRLTHSAHDQPWLEVRARHPVDVQCDGDHLGRLRAVRLTAHPAALRLLTPWQNR